MTPINLGKPVRADVFCATSAILLDNLSDTLFPIQKVMPLTPQDIWFSVNIETLSPIHDACQSQPNE